MWIEIITAEINIYIANFFTNGALAEKLLYEEFIFVLKKFSRFWVMIYFFLNVYVQSRLWSTDSTISGVFFHTSQLQN